LRINICFPDSISFYGVDPIARDFLVISHWKKHNKGNTKLKLIQGLNYRWRATSHFDDTPQCRRSGVWTPVMVIRNSSADET
jgi:hypothetical protein